MTRIKWFLTGLLTAMTLGVGAQVSPIPPANGFPLWGLPAAQGTSSNPFIDVVFTGQALGPVGNCTTAPAYSFTGDTNTGWSSSAADALCAVTGGTSRLAITSTAVTSTVPVLVPDGTAGAPSYSFSNEASSGWYLRSAGNVALSVAGTAYLEQSGNITRLKSDAQLGWSSGAIGTAPDVLLSRGAANRLDLATGDDFNLVDGEIYMQATEVMRRGTWNSVANVVVLNPGGGRTAFGGDIAIGGGNVAISATAPTVTSAGTSPSVTASNGTAAFRVNVGTGGTATTIVMAMPAATTGWNCFAENITATAANRANQRVVMVSSTTTSITVQNTTISTGAALAFTASDIVAFICTAY